MPVSRLLFLLCALAGFLPAQQVPVQQFVLDNGMRFLVVQRKGSPNVAAGWVAKVGSVNERPGITGMAHLFEHMMFKGTHTIGTKDIEKDIQLNLELDRVRGEIRKEQRELERKARLGLIENPADPTVRSPRHKELLESFNKLNQQQKDLLVKNEFDRIYTSAGAAGMNAGTNEDYTVYFISVPSNKLELWYWMESDRLANPVFREFYAERDVVHEERRMRVDSTPTGLQLEQFDAMFWKSSPYGWPVIGWPSDLEGITREEALAFFNTNYAPNNITAALVGDVDLPQAKSLAEKYFGRLKRGDREPEPVRTDEEPQYAAQRMIAYAYTNPELRIRFHTVPDGHKDEYALAVIGFLMNDRTGRLYRSLVLEQQVANGAAAGQSGMLYEGYFEFRAVVKPGKKLEELEEAIYREIMKLQNEPVPERELQKVKNQLAASNFRRLQSDFALMYQLLIAEAWRGWRSLNEDPAKLQAVTAADIQQVAKKYFAPSQRSVLLLRPKSEAPKALAETSGGVQ
jgi:predicted Zn-dependent peptidase